MERRRPRRHWHRGSLLSHQTQKPKKKFKNEKASQGKKLASIVAKNLFTKSKIMDDSNTKGHEKIM